MPTNKNALTRFLILDELLSDRSYKLSLDDLTEEVNKRLVKEFSADETVVRRTIEKDLQYLEYGGPFSAEIERYSVYGFISKRGVDGMKRCLRYADPSFSIFKKELTDKERTLLKGAMSLLGQFDGLPNFEGLEALLQGVSKVEDDRKVISFTKNPIEGTSYVGQLYTAISDKVAVELHYHLFANPDDIRVETVHPYLLKEYNRRWFVFGAVDGDMKIVCFALDRIDKVVFLTSPKYVEYDGDINEIFDDIIGVTLHDDEPLRKIVFWVSDKSKDYVATKPLHDSQASISGDRALVLREKYPSLENGRFFSITCKYNYELERELASFGKELLVLEPSEIQDVLWDRINGMLDSYRNIIGNK